MKSIREWLHELPDGMAQEALKMCGAGKVPADTLSEAVARGFAWNESPSGCSYWRGVYDGLRAVGK